MAVILIALGLIITGIDKWYVLDIAYPAFHVAGAVGKHELSPSIQLYTTGNILGDHVKIDLLPDALGCLLLLIGALMLVKKNIFWTSARAREWFSRIRTIRSLPV